jgi:hypothetical protein
MTEKKPAELIRETIDHLKEIDLEEVSSMNDDQKKQFGIMLDNLNVKTDELKAKLAKYQAQNRENREK